MYRGGFHVSDLEDIESHGDDNDLNIDVFQPHIDTLLLNNVLLLRKSSLVGKKTMIDCEEDRGKLITTTINPRLWATKWDSQIAAILIFWN